jgi:DnaK suppressor protein
MSLLEHQREELGRILEREQNRLMRRLQRFGRDRQETERAGFSQHMAEDASALTEQETAYLLASEEGRRLLEVRQALDRLVRRPSEFGLCGHCGERIGFERLEAVPYTDSCIGCKRIEEERGSRRSE